MTSLYQFISKYIGIILLLCLLSLSCKKTIDSNTTNIDNTPPDLSTKINSSVAGFVTDENNAAVEAAMVYFGTETKMTDNHGYFEFSNVEVVKTAAVVTVKKSNYFNAIKTYSVTPGKSAFFRIKLLPKSIAGTINASNGGNVSLANGLTVSLSANSVVLASNNTPYNGDIAVAVNYLDPEATDLANTMPGDLRAIDKNGNLKGLTTFGMAAIELSSASGELLQVANGKNASISFPLSTTLSAEAPGTIPMWYFNEQQGLWLEDGTATRSGNFYTATVGHFSYWNCDLPNAIVPLSFTVVDDHDRPLPNQHIAITPTANNSWAHINGYTDASGFISVFATPNTNYRLEIFNCSQGQSSGNYIQNFSVTTEAADLGKIVAQTSDITVTGTATDCNGNPITDGYIFAYNGSYTRYPIDNTGTYSFSSMYCNTTASMDLIAHNNITGEESPSAAYSLAAGVNTISNIQACGYTAAQEFISYTYDGVTKTMTFANDDTLYMITIQGGYKIVGAHPTPTGNSDCWAFQMNATGMAAGTQQDIGSMEYVGNHSPALYLQQANGSHFKIFMTEVGNVGEYMAGHYAGIVANTPQGPVFHNIEVFFRIRRMF